MTDIYDALLNGEDAPVNNTDIVARLRQQQSLGQLAQLSGIAGLQKMGPGLQNSADTQADLLYKTRQMAQAKKDALEQQASLASEREKDRLAIADQGSKDRALQRTLSQNLADERITAGQEKISDAANTKAAAALDKDKEAYNGAADGLDRLEAGARQLRDHPGLSKITGLVGGNTWDITDDARDAAQLLHTLGSQTTIQTMLALKNASKTGSTGFGQLSEAEGAKLQDSIAPLGRSQSTDAMKAALNKIIDYTTQAKKRLKEGLDAEAIGAAARASAGPTMTVTQGFKGGSALPLSRRSIAPVAVAPAGNRPPLSSYDSTGG